MYLSHVELRLRHETAKSTFNIMCGHGGVKTTNHKPEVAIATVH